MPDDAEAISLRDFFNARLADIALHFEARINDLEKSQAAVFAANDLRYEQRWAARGVELLHLQALIAARLDAMDRASIILADNVTRVPTLLDRSVSTITNLTDEKFAGVQRQFAERDVRSDVSLRNADTAVTAALSAAREAVSQQNAAYAAASAKTEAATTKQIDGIVALLGSQSQALNDKITAINQRLDRDQGQHSGSTSTIATIITLAAVVVAVLSLGLNFVSNRPEPAPIIVSPPPTLAK